MVRQAWRIKLLTEFDGLVLVTAAGETWVGRGSLSDAIDYFRSRRMALWGMEGFRTDGAHVIATPIVVDWDEDEALHELDWDALCQRTADIAQRHCDEWVEAAEVEFVEFNVELEATS